jgi:hypothetical protein
MNTSRIKSLPECRALGVVPLELMVSFRSVPAAGQLRLATCGALWREIRHATMTGMITFAAAGRGKL